MQSLKNLVLLQRLLGGFFFFFTGPHLCHMEVPELGVESGAAAAGLHYSSQQRQI